MSARTKPNDRWTEYETPWVSEMAGEPFRYLVESVGTPGRVHVVDLTSNDGIGVCSCQHFHLVALPNYHRHGQYIPYAPGRQGVTECKHIRAAADHYHQHVTRPMLASMKNGIPRPSP